MFFGTRNFSTSSNFSTATTLVPYHQISSYFGRIELRMLTMAVWDGTAPAARVTSRNPTFPKWAPTGPARQQDQHDQNFSMATTLVPYHQISSYFGRIELRLLTMAVWDGTAPAARVTSRNPTFPKWAPTGPARQQDQHDQNFSTATTLVPYHQISSYCGRIELRLLTMAVWDGTAPAARVTSRNPTFPKCPWSPTGPARPR